MNRLRRQQEETDRLTRIAIVDKDRCKPKNCGLACKKSCPVNRMGRSAEFFSVEAMKLEASLIAGKDA